MTILKEKVPRDRDGGPPQGGALAICILAVTLLLVLFPLSGGAHPPKEVAVSYDQTRQVLEVRITHGVSDPTKHFIDAVEIRKAGKVVSKTEYKSQPGQENFVYSYPFDAVAGDVVEAKGSCSVFGSKTGKLVVGK